MCVALRSEHINMLRDVFLEIVSEEARMDLHLRLAMTLPIFPEP